jgi:hypothetical protein
VSKGERAGGAVSKGERAGGAVSKGERAGGAVRYRGADAGGANGRGGGGLLSRGCFNTSNTLATRSQTHSCPLTTH